MITRIITEPELDKAYASFNKKFWEIHRSKNDYTFTDDDYKEMLKCALLTVKNYDNSLKQKGAWTSSGVKGGLCDKS